MAKRESISKRLRFDVFKRDLFCCQYCGKTPPMVVLEIDHIIPVSKKGSNLIDNLITACFDCNRGKAANELTILPATTIDKVAIIAEKELQYKEYQKLLMSVEKRLNREVEVVNKLYSLYFPDKEFSDSFKASIKMFLKKIGLKNVTDALDRSVSRINNSNECLNYLCGICWNMIKNNRSHIDDKGGNDNG